MLNVDGCIGALFLDLLHSSACFSAKEIDDIISIGYLNGLFVLARSIGLIGECCPPRGVCMHGSLLSRGCPSAAAAVGAAAVWVPYQRVDQGWHTAGGRRTSVTTSWQAWVGMRLAWPWLAYAHVLHCCPAQLPQAPSADVADLCTWRCCRPRPGPEAAAAASVQAPLGGRAVHELEPRGRGEWMSWVLVSG